MYVDYYYYYLHAACFTIYYVCNVSRGSYHTSGSRVCVLDHIYMMPDEMFG